MPFAYDFHVHTSSYSTCSQSPPEAMCQRALDAELSGIALTEHDAWWPLSEIELLRNQFPDLVIFQGVEFSCPEGHFLVFLPDNISGKGLTPYPIRALTGRVHGMGGIIIWAHPFRYDRSIPKWLGDFLPDGIEVASTNMDLQAAAQAKNIAARLGIRTFENSDAHDAHSVGIYSNRLPYLFRTNEDLIEYTRKGFLDAT